MTEPIAGSPEVLRVADPELAARAVADEIIALVEARRAEGRAAVLGLATGRTPLGIYRLLREACAAGRVSFQGAVTFNLDEYLGLGPEEPASFRAFMQRELFDHVDILPGDIHIPDGRVTLEDLPDHCSAYEEAIERAGGIDLQLLGLGRNGHVGFNEPGSLPSTRTRLVELHPLTRTDAAGSFGSLEQVPTHAISMGISTIAAARALRVLAFGEGKAEAVSGFCAGEPGPACPASLLRGHPDSRLWVDDAAASGLGRD